MQPLIVASLHPSRSQCDDIAERFLVGWAGSKGARKRLVKNLVEVPRNRMDLLPHFARLIRSIAPALPIVSEQVVKEVEREFRYFTRNNKAKGHMMESRVKNARYISELTKFRVAPPIVAIRCMQACMVELQGGNVEVLCCIMEGCGRFLKRGPGAQRIDDLIEGMEKKRKAGKMDPRMKSLIFNAINYVKPPPPPPPGGKICAPKNVICV